MIPCHYLGGFALEIPKMGIKNERASTTEAKAPEIRPRKYYNFYKDFQ
jgi:hypothetical protein